MPEANDGFVTSVTSLLDISARKLATQIGLSNHSALSQLNNSKRRKLPKNAYDSLIKLLIPHFQNADELLSWLKGKGAPAIFANQEKEIRESFRLLGVPSQAIRNCPEFFVMRSGLQSQIHYQLTQLAEYTIGVALTGLAGIGKTTLAADFAKLPDLRLIFTEGIYWVNLTDHPGFPERAFLDAIDHRWDFTDGVEALRASIYRETRGKRCLFIINGADDLRHALQVIERIDSMKARFLLTTRKWINPADEQQHLLRQIAVPEMTLGETKNLVNQILSLDLNDRDSAVLAQFYDVLGGHPLAFRILGGLALHIPSRDRWSILFERFQANGLGMLRLPGPETTSTSIPASLEAILGELKAESDRLLRIFIRIAQFGRLEMSREDLRELAGENRDIEAQLDYLVHAGLLTLDYDQGCYRVPKLLRQWANKINDS